MTKADVRRDLKKFYHKAIVEIDRCNMDPSVSAKHGYLMKSIELLNKCLEIRPGNHYLRLQKKICRENAEEIMKTRSKPTKPVPMILDRKRWKK